MPSLRYLDDAGRLRVVALDSNPFLIGRAESCQLTFDSEMISREHLRIDMADDGRFRVRDLGSRNKTFVNGELIRETLLSGGAVIRVGDRVLEFVDDATSPQAADLSFLTPDRTEPPDCEWIKIKAPLSLTLLQIEKLAQLVGDQPLTARAEDIADAAMGHVILDLGAERGLIALRGEGKTDLHPLAHRSLACSPGHSMTPVSQSFVLAPLLRQVAGRYPHTSVPKDTKQGYAVTGVVAPLTFHGDVVGVIYVDRPQGKRGFAGSALPYLAAAGAQIGALLGGSSSRLSQPEGRDGGSWMSTMRRLQVSLSDPVVPSDGFDVATKFVGGRLQCGDFVSVVHLDEQRCGFIMVDGGGQGLSGLAQSCSVRRAVQAALAVSDDALMDPASMFNALNDVIASAGARQVLPCVFVGLDLSSGRLAYINAGGMAPLLMVGPGRLVTLDKVSLILGVDARYGYEVARVDLPEAFRVVCFTDGLVEATSATGEPFGDTRLHDTLLERDAFAPASDLVATIAGAWTTHMATAQPADDATVLVVSRDG